ncbi:MAG: hypothetical protein IT341_07130 [Chloroflexi bacterium]|nr:hypothetical protein [Chloroflexota bacterium]
MLFALVDAPQNLAEGNNTMGIERRMALYSNIEQIRGRPLVAYVTGTRPGATAKISSDAIGELLRQLDALPADATCLDLLLASNGGDPLVAWRMVSHIRERVDHFAVLVPQAAFSAATLIALGADEIVMHRYGNLGPIDPQITSVRRSGDEGPATQTAFGSEDAAAFLDFARNTVGLTDQGQLVRVFELLCSEVGAVPIGVAARSTQLSLSMGEKLLRMHMASDAEAQQARNIAEALNKTFQAHGYPLSRTEAEQMGLKVIRPEPDLEGLISAVWQDIEAELNTREPFNPTSELASSGAAAALFGPAPQVNIPAGLPPEVQQQVLQNVLQKLEVVMVPPVDYTLVLALMESARWASRFEMRGVINAQRLPSSELRVTSVQKSACWRSTDQLIAGGGRGADGADHGATDGPSGEP